MAAATAAASAVSAGLVAGVTDTAKQAVADSYQKVKALLVHKYPAVDVDIVEARPLIESRRVVLTEELAAAGARADSELAAVVQALLEVIHDRVPQAAEIAGVRVTELEAGEVEIRDIETMGADGVVADRVKVDGKFSVQNVRVVPQPPHPH